MKRLPSILFVELLNLSIINDSVDLVDNANYAVICQKNLTTSLDIPQIQTYKGIEGSEVLLKHLTNTSLIPHSYLTHTSLEKKPRRTDFKTTALFCSSYTDVLMKQRRCFKLVPAKHQRGAGKRVDCRRLFKRVLI